MRKKRCFVQWFLLTLAYGVGAFFATMSGLSQAIWQGDVTHMTSVIAAVFVAALGYLGFACWNFDRPVDASGSLPARNAQAEANAAIGRAAAFVVTLIGLLGTAIGLMLQVKALGSVHVNDPASIVAFIGTIGSALSTALYATSCGITACIGLTLVTTNLEYFIDSEQGQ